MTQFAGIIDDLKDLPEPELRQTIFTLDGEGPDAHQLYPHQLEGLRRIELGSNKEPPVSGILHYPTGAGKTRVALQLIARGLAENPEHRFVWATARKQLLRQSMIRMAELANVFPNGTTFGWSLDADDAEDSHEDIQVCFMTRSNLTDVLERAADGRRKSHPWRRHLELGHPMTLIYDECHQLGAKKLQAVWRRFHDQVIKPPRSRHRQWRTLGLSATPIPTQPEAHRLLGECIFPRRQDGPSTSHDWPFHFFHRVPNETLIQNGVLCPLNSSFDDSGYFDVPATLLRDVTGETDLVPPGPDAEAWEIQEYSIQFNRSVMGDPRVLGFLAERLGERLHVLGKTIVFVPTIDAANRLAALLYERFPEARGSVATVHNKIHQVRLPGQDKATVHQVLDQFRERGPRPSILINVDMLTEGFDDPKIKTVVLARLTLSTNRFWQMIGRGTRGPASGGTTECNIIDPVKLVRLYDYFSGYQPDIHRHGSVELERSEDGEERDAPGGGALSPEVPVGTRPPDPGSCPYVIDPDVVRLHRQVAIALQHFLEGNPISECHALEAVQVVGVDLSEGRPLLRATTKGFEAGTAMTIILGELASLELRSGKDLNWFRNQLPPQLDEALLVQRLRALRAIEALSLWTETAYASALTSGAFLQALQTEALGKDVPQGVDGKAPQSGEATVAAPQRSESTLTAVEEATIDAAVALIQSDAPGAVLSFPERVTIANTLRDLFGTKPTEELNTLLMKRLAPGAVPFELLNKQLSSENRQRFLRDMAELASATRTVSSARQATLANFAAKLEIPSNVASAILGTSPDSGAAAPSSGVTCTSCAFDVPAAASFCPGCGRGLRSA